LIKNSFVRAKFMEMLAASIGERQRQSEFFMTGMFSSLDILLGRDMSEIIDELRLPEDVKGALCGTDNKIKTALDLVMNYELLEWDELDKGIQSFQIESARLRQIYLDALVWAMSLEY
jgi:c-di-GMP-related signal transduction protein